MTSRSYDQVKRQVREERGRAYRSLQQGPATFEQLREAMDCDERRARIHLRKLVADGVVCRLDIDGAAVYELWEHIGARMRANAAPPPRRAEPRRERWDRIA